MANNTNAQAITVSDQQLRPLADSLMQLYNRCKALQIQYTAQSWASLFPNTSDLVADGAVTGPDGRQPITNADLNTLFGIVTSFITYMEQSSNANRNCAAKIAVNPTR